jgi:Ca-activated chloride channel family protein
MPSLPTHWSFSSPGRLLLLLAVLSLAAAYVLVQRRRPPYETRFADVELLESVMPKRPGWRRHLPAGLLLVTLVALTTGFARPSADVRVPRGKATVVVALDVSGSMMATDVSPTRIEAAKAAAQAFVRSLPKSFDVGLVSFSGTATVVVPPSQNRTDLTDAIASLPLGGGTAIGDAVGASVQAAQAVTAVSTSKAPVRIVLLSDGANTVGQSVDQGAQQAVAAGMPVTTIAYGTPEGVVFLGGQAIPVPVDAVALRGLAQTTGGQSYAAQDAGQLKDVYNNIGKEVGTTSTRRDLTAALTGLGLMTGLAAAGASLVWFRVLP